MSEPGKYEPRTPVDRYLMLGIDETLGKRVCVLSYVVIMKITYIAFDVTDD